MQKSTSQVLKEMAPWIIVSVIITGVINWLFSILGISLGAGISEMITNSLGSFPLTPEPISPGVMVIQNIAGLFVVGLTGLIGAALALGIYRNLRYDTKMRFEDLFYFFNHHFLFNFLSSVLISLITTIGFILFFIPGIVASLGLLPWGIWLGKHQKDEKISPKEIVSDTWNSTKGKKGMIFGNYLLYMLIIIAIFVAAIVLMVLIMSSAGAGENLGAGSILFMSLISIPLSIIMIIVAYVPWINSVRTLAEDGVFDEVEEVNIEDDIVL